MKMLSSLSQWFHARREMRGKEALADLKARYHTFRIFLENNGRALELMVGIDKMINRSEEPEIRTATEELLSVTSELVDGLNLLSGDAHAGLYSLHGQIAAEIMQYIDIIAKNRDNEAYCPALDDLGPDAHPIAGTKATNLARLRHLALPVPNGFVCTTRVCKHFVGKGQLAAAIRRHILEYEHGHQDINQTAATIEKLILHTPLPTKIADALAEAYKNLQSSEERHGANLPLAISVRSSGVSEDGVDYSFAGQFTSILNVIDIQGLFDAYRAVVASGFSPRAISYRLRAGLNPVDFDFAVLCQVMAKADCAGVLFTRDPSQPENDRMLISAVPGLGTMAVEGSAAVDLYRPRRAKQSGAQASVCSLGSYQDLGTIGAERTEELLDGAEISQKNLREVPSPEGGVHQETLSEEEANLSLLTVETLAQLMCLGEIIENLEGIDQDIEWAYSKERGLAILQARPLQITAAKGRRRRSPTAADRGVGQVHTVRAITDLQQFSDPTVPRNTVIPPERQALRQMIVPLNLPDASGPTFPRKECRSIHDVVRYTHEMAILAMFSAGDSLMEDAGGLLRPLDIGGPFSFLVIDVGGGTRRVGKPSLPQRLALQHPLNRKDILSIPLAALCDGLTTPGLSWHSDPNADALPGIFSRSLLDGRTVRPAGSFNYALAARDYLNLKARVELNFAMLDSICGRDSQANYIRFRFKGGGAGSEGGGRRAIFLKQVLERNGFYTTVVGDLVTASLTGAGQEIISERLVMLGRLLGFSRFLDGIMTSDEIPALMAEAFLSGRYDRGWLKTATKGCPQWS